MVPPPAVPAERASSGVRLSQRAAVPWGRPVCNVLGVLSGSHAQQLKCEHSHVKLPVIEDLVNSPALCLYSEWMAAQEEDSPVWGPRIFSNSVRRHVRAGPATRGGGPSCGPTPWVPFNLDPDSHFQAAICKSTQATPFAASSSPNVDLWFAATSTVALGPQLNRTRQSIRGTFSEPARPWQG